MLARFERLLRARAGHPAFDPYGDMQVLAANESVFVVLRSTPDGTARVLCLHNVSDHDQIVPLDVRPLLGVRHGPLQDLVTGRQQTPRDNLRLLPYQTLWLASGSWPAGDSL